MTNDKKIMDEFVSTLSHEIRTPLTSIKGFSKTLYDNYDVLSDEQKKKFLQIIMEQSQRLIALVENVLNVAKLDCGANDVILKEVNLKDCINTSVEMLKINCKNRAFEMNFSKNLQTSLCDKDKLQQILVNIIENACKYSPENSTITINAKNEGAKNIIEVQNEGEEIKKEDLDKIFDKFYRVENHLQSKTQGSGLGLYIAKNLARQSGLEIEVQSDCNLTKFSIILPIFEVEKITKHIADLKNV